MLLAIPKVWRTTTSEAAIAARQAGCAKALRRILGDHVDAPGFARGAELLTKAATSAPFEGRPMYAALRAIPIPNDVVARLEPGELDELMATLEPLAALLFAPRTGRRSNDSSVRDIV